MKYIAYSLGDTEYAIVFPEHLVHQLMWKAARRTMDGMDVPTILGAGFVCRTKDGVVCVRGYSESLNLGSRPEDVAAIEGSIL